MDWCVDPSVPGWRDAVETDLAAHLARRIADAASVEGAMRRAAPLLDGAVAGQAAPQKLTLLWDGAGHGVLQVRGLDAVAGSPLPGVAIGPGVSGPPWGPGAARPPTRSQPPVSVALGVDRSFEEALDADVGSVRLPSGRDQFLTAILALGYRQQGAQAEEAAAFAGAAAAHRAEEEHRQRAGAEGPLDARGMAEAFVAYQRAIGGDFEIDEVSAEHAVVSNTACPFGDVVSSAPSLCRVTSAMLGGIAAKHPGGASVTLDERLALGDRRCQLTVRLGATAGNGGHRYTWPPAGIPGPSAGSSRVVLRPAATAVAAAAARVRHASPPSIELSLQLPHDRGSVRLVRHVARQSLEAIDVTPDVIAEIELALSEACTNVLNHAGPGDAYEVAVHVRGDRCELAVTDRGRGFDYQSVRTHDAGAEAERGRGLAIMEAVMDGVELASEPQQGTLVTLVRQLTFRPGSQAKSVLLGQTGDLSARDDQRSDPSQP